MTTTTETNRTYATGKRKTAIARVWLSPGSGKVLVNGKPADEYFERPTSRMIMRQALELIEVVDQYDVWATVLGGGHSAQAEAMRHGIARALITIDPERRSAIKRAGFLTRDARKKERKKYGQPGARKRFQYSKR
jgi:small subunit ribosomal protein S9